jgi:predicted N-acetyltransferase YhbS
VPIPAAAAVVVGGAQYLKLATTLLQRIRLTAPAGGIWEAADVQWWSRRERGTDAGGQLFWLERGGEPVAAVLRTGFPRTVQCDVLVRSADPGDRRAVWRTAISRVDASGVPAEFPVRPEDAVAAAELGAAGFRPDCRSRIVASWLPASRRPKVPPLAAGYRLLDRADAPDRPYPLAERNGPEAEQRLRRCSLYRPELDLMVEAPDGRTAGYGLFWADPVTAVGLVEPIRTEQAHQRRGIASHLLAAGLDRLAANGCRRLKVSSDLGLYQRAGFRPASTAAVYARITVPSQQS